VEDRITSGLYLETTNDPDYEETRVSQVLGRPGVRRATWWANAHPNRRDLPRTMDEFATLGVYEVGEDFSPPEPAGDVAGHHYRQYPRPGQGSLTGHPTDGLLLVWISPRRPEGAQELRDWGDFVHLRYIAEASVPGYAMITPYEAVSEGSPLFMHFYEMNTDDPEATFRSMTPLVRARLDDDTYADWETNRQLRIDYVNTFRLVGRRPD